ncbi:MAG: LEA type 2 family protein [Truepera sp.]|nr:LEA type 2 family protein [Truepera sp.]
MMRWLAITALGLVAACAPTVSAPVREAQVVRPLVFELLDSSSLGKFNPPGAGATITLGVDAVVSNPNSFPVSLHELDFRLYLADQAAVAGRYLVPKRLEPGETAGLQFEVAISLQQPGLLRAVAEAFAGTPLPVRIDGAVTVSTLGYQPSFAPAVLMSGVVQARETLSPPLLQMSEAESEVFWLEPGVPVVRVVGWAINPGGVGYFVYGTDLSLTLNGQLVASADLTPSPVPAGGAGRIEILFYPDLNALGAEAREALSEAIAGTPLPLAVHGELRLDVLGLGTFPVASAWQLTGQVAARGF